MLKRFAGLMVAALVLVVVGCETPYPAPPPPPPLPRAQPPGPADIKMLAKSGVSDEVIISQIRNAHVVYHLTTAEILDMAAAGVSQKVIDFMINTPSLYRSSAPPPPRY